MAGGIMGRIIFIVLFVLTAFITACSEDLDPFGEISEKYVLNCVIRPDVEFQTLTLTRNYPAPNYNPYENTMDPSIRGAHVRIWIDSTQNYVFSERVVERDSSSLYKTPFALYWANMMMPEPGTVIKMEAILNNGRKLEATSTSPVKVKFLKQGEGGDGDSIVPPPSGSAVLVRWKKLDDIKYAAYAFKLQLVYKVNENGNITRKTKLVPRGYYTSNGREFPEYFEITPVPFYYIEMETIDKVMAEISEGDPDKSKYTIYALEASVASLDEGLSAYFYSIGKNRDPFAVKLYGADYTNIKGGLGVFGIMTYTFTSIDLTYNYVKSFGYNHAYKNH